MTAALTTTPSIPIDPRISAIAAGIAAAIQKDQFRLYGSRVKGTSRPDSDVDLLITGPDQWLAVHDRVRVWGDLWRQFSSHRLLLDLLLYGRTAVSQRQQCETAVTSLAYQEGVFSMVDPDSLPYLRINQADLVEARRMVELSVFRDSSIGFRLQQACEKALKSWIHAKGGLAPFPHDSSH